MLWNKAVFCLEVLIYKRLQMWRHNDVIGRNEYLISTRSESTVPQVYSLQFLFRSTQHSWRYGRKCEWVFFFWTQCRQLFTQYHSFCTQHWFYLWWKSYFLLLFYRIVSYRIVSYMHQILTDFQNFFCTGTFCGKFVIKWLMVTRYTTTP